MEGEHQASGEDVPSWPAIWLDDRRLEQPADWRRPGIVLVFDVRCAGCVSRAVPWLVRADAVHGGRLVFAAVHTALGRRAYAREQVEPTLRSFADRARLGVPIALDLDGSWAEAAGAEGTPHWFAYDAGGALLRSVYGSQANALTRLDYLLEELAGD